jgi:antitoxin Phd
MKTLRLREAKATLSAVVDAAERGEATLITRNGRPAAVVTSVEDASKLYPVRRPSFASLLTSLPVDAEFSRDETPLRPAKL